MNRLDCSGSSCFGFVPIRRFYQSANGRSNWSSGHRSQTRPEISRSIGEALSFDALKRQVRALHVVDTKLGAIVHSEIKLREIPFEVTLIHVVINADQAALEYREKAFEGVHVYVAACPLEFRVIDAFGERDGRVFVVLRLIGNEAALFVNVLVEKRPDALVIERHGADRTAALDKAKNVRLGALATGALVGFARIGDRGFVGLYGFAFAAKRTINDWVHGEPDAMPKVPSGFHAAAQGPLKLAGADAFLAGTHEMDRLKPQAKREVAILENGVDPDGEWLAARVALAEARTGGFAVQSADLVAGSLAMGAHRTGGPKPRLDVGEGGFLAMKLGGGKDRISHDGPRFHRQSYMLPMGMSSETSPINIP